MMLFCHFVRRGYPLEYIHSAFVKAASQSRETLLEKQWIKIQETEITTEEDEGLFVITTYDPESNILGKMVRENWDLLRRSAATKLLAETKLTFGLCRPPNLKDLLVCATAAITKSASFAHF